jgi:16S rRNA (guanine(966)-N(2))-methyltransferase RsmD
MIKLCNAAPAFFRVQPGGTGRNFTQPIVTRRLQSLLCCAARASFRLKSVTVAGAKQVLTGPNFSLKNKVRIIGGEWRSRIISLPEREDVRPTPDRVRETVFNWLGQDLSGKNCLDLFAGSGAMGFEAASRGAVQVVMVESDPDVLKSLRVNIQTLAAPQVRLVAMDALKFIGSDRQLFDVIFVDPPYRLELLPNLLPKLSLHLAEDGLMYVEDDSFLEPDADWVVWRRGRAGNVYYQLLKKSEKNG